MKHTFIIMCLVVLAALVEAPHVAAAQGTDPLSIAKAWEAAINANDLNAVMALFADNATWNDTHPAPGQPNPLKGKDQIKSFLAMIIAGKPHDEASNFRVNGDMVTWFSKETLANPSAVDPNAFPPGFPFPIESNLTAVVQNGKITSFTVDNTAEWFARVEKFFASRTTPTTGANIPNSAWLFAFAGAGLLVAGVIILRRQLTP